MGEKGNVLAREENEIGGCIRFFNSYYEIKKLTWKRKLKIKIQLGKKMQNNRRKVERIFKFVKRANIIKVHQK